MKPFTLPDNVVLDLKHLAEDYPTALDMLIVVHTLRFMIEQQANIVDAITYYARNTHQPYRSNPFFASPEDWKNGVMRDDWQISFHVTLNQDDKGKPSPTLFLQELEQLAHQVSLRFRLAQSHHRLPEFFQAFAFDAQKACLQARLQKVLDTDWSAPLAFEELMHRFMHTLPEAANEATILAAYPDFFKEFENLQLGNHTVNQVSVTAYLEALYGYDFSFNNIQQQQKSLSQKSSFSLTANWADIKTVTHTLSRSQEFYVFYFDQLTLAQSVLNWFRAQPALRPLGIMRASIKADSQPLTVLLSTMQFAALDSLYPETVLPTPKMIAPEASSVAPIDQKAVNALYRKLHSTRNEDFITLIENTPAPLIEAALMKQNNQDWTALHLVALFQSEAAFLALIQKVNSQALERALVRQNDESMTPLHLAARYRSEAIFLALVQKVRREALEAALVIQTRVGYSSAFHLIAQYQSEAAFLMLIQKVSSQALERALVRQDDKNETPLHMAARYQNEAAFLALIQKVSSQALETALVKQTNDNYTALHLAARYQSEAAFLALIQKVSSQALETALVKQTNDNYTALHLAARHQSEPAFLALLNRISLRSLNQSTAIKIRTLSFAKDLKNIFGIALVYQSSEAVNNLMEKLPLALLIKLIGDDPIFFIERFRPCLLHPSIQGLSPEKLNYLFTVNPQAFIGAFTKAQALNKATPERVEIKKQIFSQCGAPSNTPDIEQAAPAFKAVHDVISQGNALLKIIKIEHWSDFIEQIHNPNHRPRLRGGHQNASFKLDLPTGKIVKRQLPKPPPAVPTHTRKHAMTLLSPELITATFGEHDPTRPRVGLLFNLTQCDPRAFFAQDCGTYYKQWASNYNHTVKAYVVSTRPYYFTVDRLPAFKQRVKASFVYNEVLVRIPYQTASEAMLAVIVADDTSQTRKIARDRVADIQKKWNKTLPIIFYNRFNAALQLYAQSEQQADEAEFEEINKFEVVLLSIIEKGVAAIQQDKSKKSPERMGFFSSYFISNETKLLHDIQTISKSLSENRTAQKFIEVSQKIIKLIEKEKTVQDKPAYQNLVIQLQTLEEAFQNRIKTSIALRC